MTDSLTDGHPRTSTSERFSELALLGQAIGEPCAGADSQEREIVLSEALQAEPLLSDASVE
jgi:hypothetical protein